MFIIFYIICLIVGLAFGGSIRKHICEKKCNHKWLLFRSSTVDFVNSKGQEVQIGYVKFYECEHCKKMKKEEIRID